MEDTERKLASVQKALKIIPIENADAIELVKVMGWQCVVKKGEFKEGDFGVFFEVDSFLPIDERYEFLRKSSYKQNPLNGEGFRIKTTKLRGALSQGVFLPLGMFPEICETYQGNKEGVDVTEFLEVKKWTVPEISTSGGITKGTRPSYIPKTDEIRIQSAPELLDEIRTKPYYITTKMDGTSGTVFSFGGEIGACSRNQEIKEGKDALYWQPVFKYGLKEKFEKIKKVDVSYINGVFPVDVRNISFNGEIVGPGIQKNRLGLTEIDWYVFDVYLFDEDGPRYANFYEFTAICEAFGLKTVPIEEQFESFNYRSVDELLERARGKYPSGKDKEGIVIRRAGNAGQKDVSFKVINNDYLLKE